MIRVLLFLCLLAALALADAWFMERPGQIVLTWQGYQVETSVAVGLAIVFGFAALLTIIWTLLRFTFRIPSLVAFRQRRRRRDKGYAALSRGMIAAGTGDLRLAKKSAAEAQKRLPDEPLVLLLAAQTAQLAGERMQAEGAFQAMANRDDTRLLGLRGLHIEAQRRGDIEAALQFAAQAHEITPLPWSGKAVLDHRACNADWQSALATLESNISAKIVDRETGDRQRAVLETAIAEEKALSAPDEALRLARSALKSAPDFVPAIVLAARLWSRKGDIRKAAKLIEGVWQNAPHPELANVYLDLRPGDSNADRLHRAETLARLAPNDPESLMAVATAALAAHDYALTRKTLLSLIEGQERPTARMCLLMAELEEAEHGAAGAVREWLARGSRAPRDAVWMADGIASEKWLPASPATVKLDAFVWQRPAERLGAPIEAAEPLPPIRPPAQNLVEATSVAEPVPASPEEEATVEPVTIDTIAKPAAKPAGPVVFPLPGAPDDPGLEGQKSKGQTGLLF